VKIPSEWLYEAKACRARYDDCPDLEVHYLIKAGKWDLAHGVFVKSLAPRWTLCDDQSRMWEVMKSFDEHAGQIRNWRQSEDSCVISGQTYFDYLSFKRSPIMSTLNQDNDIRNLLNQIDKIQPTELIERYK